MKVSEIMTVEPVVINGKESKIGEAMAKMKGTDIHQIPIVTGKQYEGMLNYREIMRRRSIQLSAKVQNFIIKTPEFSKEDDAKEVVRMMQDTGLSAFPVVKKGKLEGIVSRSDIIRNISGLMDSDSTRNRQLMSVNPILVEEDENIESASIKMRGLDETEIPVVTKEGKLTGILRLDEIATDTFKREKQRINGGYMASGDIGGDMVKVDVTSASLMDNPVFVKPHETVTNSADLLIRHRLHILPVVDDDMSVVGVIGISDIIDAIDTDKEKQGILIQVTGLEPEDEELYEITFAMASKFAGRFSRITNLTRGKLNIHVAKYQNEGKIKYSVRTKIIAEPLTMSLDHHDWNYGKCLSFIFETYEPRLKKWKEK